MANNKVKPCNAGKGRGKGNLNKNTAAIKDMIDQALREAGGVEYLKRQAIDNPSAFLGLIGKILPKDINVGGQPGNPIVISEIALTCPEFESSNKPT